MLEINKSILTLTEKDDISYIQFNKFKGPDLPSNDSFSKNDLLVSYIDDNDSSKDVFSDDDFLEIDGFISNVKDIATLTTAADCTSILMYDPDKNVYANIHSGWRGTVLRIVEKALSIMRFEYGCDTRNIICCIGPSIRKECFLVNEDVVEIFIDEFSNYTKRYPIIQKTDLTNEKGVQYKLDSNRIIKLMMQDAGVIEENIIDSNICTNCNSEYFHSKRKEGADDFNINGCLMSLK